MFDVASIFRPDLNTTLRSPSLPALMWVDSKMRKPSPNVSQTVYDAIKAGYRLFDGAGDYGNELEAGQGVNRALKEGIVKREELCTYTFRSSLSSLTTSDSHHFQGWPSFRGFWLI